MALRFNPFTSNLDIVGGGVQGPTVSTDTAITRWDGITGQLVQDSKAYVQDGGGIEAQGYITRRKVTDLIIVRPDSSWIAANIELELNGSIQLEADGEIIIV